MRLSGDTRQRATFDPLALGTVLPGLPLPRCRPGGTSASRELRFLNGRVSTPAPAGSRGTSLPPARLLRPPALRRRSPSAAAGRTGGRGEGTAGGAGRRKGSQHSRFCPRSFGLAGNRHPLENHLFKNDRILKSRLHPPFSGSPLLQTKAGRAPPRKASGLRHRPAAGGGSGAG